MTEVVIVSAVRTPIGKLGGSLASLNAVALGTIASQAAIEQAGIDPARIQQAIFGNVLQANSGQNVARQIGLKSGLAQSSTAMTINEVCGSGLKAVRLGQSAILLGEADAVLVGGTESMSQTPFYAPNMRFGHLYGDTTFVDGVAKDGLTDSFNHQPMGITGENVAERFNVTREQQDDFALASHQKAAAAQAAHAFDAEIVPVTIKTKRGEQVVATDEAVRPDTSLEKLAKLRPAFMADGTVTAGNASGINDGAAALVLMNKAVADREGIHYLAVIDDYFEIGIDPDIMGYAPKLAVEGLVAKTGTALDQIDQFEINEAFASQSVAVQRDLNIPAAKLNRQGGAIALGHPLGASGARLLTTLVHQLNGDQRGIASLCVGGGIGVAMQVHHA
ncbi:acetyl-CoA C-acyltransferase [Lacticaseibacillus saniviri]|uniref:acetyl-CoA C-acetyltransferase n=1 Tax=Lacticaseibacillus saniviri JCM 17471 = DSM 24301 TaxID=1293598 RepID=A0A0R2MZG2_9LACO|nr:acetyl-CoA C-acyltransferase [Lacticaseibacillus saniviri]KRO16138.1 acetyl-coa acetyltransferase [Lacticaseibacillus saniviri JCM 17471 = DSM 24301]MCG4282124.1 acetyl-CoA C-acyltransferase [Lacticaseibacillus saniviri]